MRAKTFFLLPFFIGVVALKAQSPAPIVVQPANAVSSVKSPTGATASATAQSIPDAIKSLEGIKAGNAEVLAKQKAALEKLEELQDAADQIRIFGKRG